MRSICLSLLSTLTLVVISNSAYAQEGGLLAEYYDGDNFDRYVTERYEGNIENYWNEVPPVPGIDPNRCSVRWTGKLKPKKTATYLFTAKVDDGIRVWIDGEIIINQWHLNDYGVFNGKKLLVANNEYDIKVEYFNALREAEIKLMWAIEKTSEEQSWYEYMFGVDYQYQVIHDDYFVRSTPPKSLISQEELPPPPPQKKPVQKKQFKKAKTRTPEVKPKVAEQLKTKSTSDEKEVIIKRAERFIPKNVEFVRSKSEILNSSFNELNNFAEFMVSHQQISVLIEGHTDAVGDKDMNQKLSEERAQKIAEYLQDKGVSMSRIETIGYGGSRPLKMPKKGSYYPPNRRVVFKLDYVD